MNEDKISRRRLLLAVAIVMVLHSPAKATCVYAFSYYDNVYFSSDGKSLVSSVSVVDNSGCGHSQYTTTAKISSPSGRLATQSQSGLSATVQILINGETGTWSPFTTGTFYCPVLLGFAGFGNGWTVSSGQRTTYYSNPTGGEGFDCTWHSLVQLGISHLLKRLCLWNLHR
jgi:hypothetical protein